VSSLGDDIQPEGQCDSRPGITVASAFCEHPITCVQILKDKTIEWVR